MNTFKKASLTEKAVTHVYGEKEMKQAGLRVAPIQICLLFSLFFVIWPSVTFCQNNQQQPHTFSVVTLRVFADCNECGDDFLRTEVTFVNFVRDRKQADVHILVTDQRTGSGGRKYTLEFIGHNVFENMVDTLKYFSNASDSEDNTRSGLIQTIKLGLMRYVAKTPYAKDISVQYTKPAEPVTVEDKWNYWVFEIEGGSWLSGEQSIRQINLWGNVQASRVTDQSKVWFEVWGNYNESRFEFDESTTLSISRSKGAESGIVWSLTNHWSIRYESGALSSTFRNKIIQVWNQPALEYNLFPYEQSTRRQLRFHYRFSVSHVKYEEETIFDKTEEWLTSQKLGTTLELIQPWGSITGTLSGSHFLHDFTKNNLRLRGNLRLKVIEGLSFNISGSISRVRDQLFLPKGELSQEDVLLRRRALATDYDYWTSISLSYTFGSRYNNIVNPRFGN